MMTFFRENGLKVDLLDDPVRQHHLERRGRPRPEPGRGHELRRRATKPEFFVRASQGGPPLVVPWWKGEGSPIDFTNPAARDWLTEQLTTCAAAWSTRESGKETAIGGFKTDDGEVGNGQHLHPRDGRLQQRPDRREMRNGYCVEYHKTVHGVLGDKGVLFARSGFTGTQAFPAAGPATTSRTSATQNGLPSVIVAGLSAAMSGFSIWGHDIGGYQNDQSAPVSPADLFIRWTQFGCFSPIMQMHRQVASGLQYPWSYGEAALENYRAFARLHISLFPYIYSYAKLAADTGVPIIRPLVLMNQRDPNTYGLGHTFLFGNELLVAPFIAANATQRDVYLPPGGWYDYWTNRRFEGGRVVTWTGLARSFRCSPARGRSSPSSHPTCRRSSMPPTQAAHRSSP